MTSTLSGGGWGSEAGGGWDVPGMMPSGETTGATGAERTKQSSGTLADGSAASKAYARSARMNKCKVSFDLKLSDVENYQRLKCGKSLGSESFRGIYLHRCPSVTTLISRDKITVVYFQEKSCSPRTLGVGA